MRTLMLGYGWIDEATPVGRLNTDGWRIVIVPPLLILSLPVAILAGIAVRFGWL